MWSFGVIAFELAMGKYPFAAPPVLDALAGRAIAHVRCDAAALRDEERAVLERCLDSDPAKRPTAAETARALNQRATAQATA
jgi:serine/threonine protein kinase